jgi:hypothetical protein
MININKIEWQAQMDGNFALAENFAAAPSFSETFKLLSGVMDWTQASASAT